MDLNFIKKLVKLLESTEITDIEVEENGTRIKLAKKVRVTQSINVAQPLTSASTATHGISESSKADEKKFSNEVANAGLHEVKSPIVGTFYRAPAPDADSYVQVGDVVSVGSVLCIVEAMKLMNEIESDTSGKIVKILVENGKPVEYNQPLFLIQQS
jgi:acetyl-CoA carboxylase biotin carboxyl carrier protein